MPRPAPVALLLCDAASIDAAGKVTLSGLVDVVSAPRFPAVHAELTVFWKCRFPGGAEVHLVVEAPDGRVLATTPPIRGQAGAVSQEIHRFVDLRLPVAGTYWIQLVDASGPIAEIPLEARQSGA